MAAARDSASRARLLDADVDAEAQLRPAGAAVARQQPSLGKMSEVAQNRAVVDWPSRGLGDDGIRGTSL